MKFAFRNASGVDCVTVGYKSTAEIDEAIEIHQFACLKDNYGVLIHDPEGGRRASIDAPGCRGGKEGRIKRQRLAPYTHSDHPPSC